MVDNYIDGVIYPGSSGTEYGLDSITDTTLSVSGRAADAKTVGDIIGNLEDLETEDNSDLVSAINWVLDNGGGTPATTYTITNNLTNVTNSNGATTIRENRSYTATLALATGATLESITVKMGGIDITSTAWNLSTMTISIASVTNNIVITARAIVTIEQTVTWTGSGSTSDASPGHIDATQYDMYFEIPFVEGATQLSNTATDGGNAFSVRVYLYETAEGDAIGCWDFENGEIISSGTPWASCPTIKFGERTLMVPAGYYITLSVTNNKSAFVDNSGSRSYLNANATTVYLVTPEVEPEPTPVLLNAELIDRDLLQVYETRSLATETVTDTTSYAGVIEEAKNAWMHEYSGDINKIPLIIHTDQHDTMGDSTSAAMWEAIDNMVSWYDISKCINLGDTTNSYDNYDDPTLGDTALENYLEATKHIPFSKRIEVFGNHDCGKVINSSLTYIKQEPSYLNPYFKNVMARRTSNNGYHVTYDPYFNVKYIVYSNYDYQDASHYEIVSTAQYDFLIEEMTKNDGYDIVLLGHQDVNIYQEYVAQLAKARYEKTSGSFTDKAGVSHSYNFTSCVNDLLVCLHGHSHSDDYNYDQTVLSQCFDNYYDSTRPIFFLIVDRTNKQLKAWKVVNTPAYTTYTRSFTSSS